jgi:hypothetical protein
VQRARNNQLLSVVYRHGQLSRDGQFRIGCMRQAYNVTRQSSYIDEYECHQNIDLFEYGRRKRKEMKACTSQTHRTSEFANLTNVADER